MRWSMAALALVTLAGCATMSDVRRSAPIRSGEFDADYKALATCILLAWNADSNGGYQIVVDEGHKVAIITPTPQLFGGAPMETTVRQQDGKAIVEIRQGTTLFEGLNGPWQDVTACAKSQPRAS